MRTPNWSTRSMSRRRRRRTEGVNEFRGIGPGLRRRGTFRRAKRRVGSTGNAIARFGERECLNVVGACWVVVAGLFAIEMDDGSAFRAATAAELDTALRATGGVRRGRTPGAARRRGPTRGRRRRRLTAPGTWWRWWTSCTRSGGGWQADRGSGCGRYSRRWIWRLALARGYAACDGGGRWRVYCTRVAVDGDGRLEAVLGRRLAEGLETRRQD